MEKYKQDSPKFFGAQGPPFPGSHHRGGSHGGGCRCKAGAGLGARPTRSKGRGPRSAPALALTDPCPRPRARKRIRNPLPLGPSRRAGRCWPGPTPRPVVRQALRGPAPPCVPPGARGCDRGRRQQWACPSRWHQPDSLSLVREKGQKSARPHGEGVSEKRACPLPTDPEAPCGWLMAFCLVLLSDILPETVGGGGHMEMETRGPPPCCAGSETWPK